jgi:hypothetical protein
MDDRQPNHFGLPPSASARTLAMRPTPNPPTAPKLDINNIEILTAPSQSSPTDSASD